MSGDKKPAVRNFLRDGRIQILYNFTMNAGAPNNSGSVGIYTEHQSIGIIDPVTMEIIESPLISGTSIRYHILRHYVNRTIKDVKRYGKNTVIELSSLALRKQGFRYPTKHEEIFGDKGRIKYKNKGGIEYVIRAGWDGNDLEDPEVDYIEVDTSKKDKKYARQVEQEIVKNLADGDIFGFMIAEGNSSITRNSPLHVSNVIAVRGTISMLTRARHDKLGLVVKGKEGRDIHGQQRVYPEVVSGNFWGIIDINLFELSRSQYDPSVTADKYSYNIRVNRLLDAIENVLNGDFGARRASDLPHYTLNKAFAVIIPEAYTSYTRPDWSDPTFDDDILKSLESTARKEGITPAVVMLNGQAEYSPSNVRVENTEFVADFIEKIKDFIS